MLESTIVYGTGSNTITLNDKTTHRDLYKVSRVIMDSVKMRRGIESLEKREGAEDFGSYRDIRIVQLFGSIIAPDIKTLNNKEATLRKMFNPHFAEFLSSDGKGYLPLKWTEEFPSTTRQLQMYLKPYTVPKIDEDETEKLRRRFEITLVAKDPKKYDQQQTVLNNITSNYYVVNGDDFTYPIIEIEYTKFTSPGTITNTTTGKYITLTGSFTGTLTIDMENGTIKEGSTNKISMFTAGSEFWELAPGSNVITFTNITNITIKYYKAYA